MVLRSKIAYGICAAIGVFALSGESAQARTPTVLQPSSKWNIDYGEDRCRLIRQFGEGDTLVELHIEQASANPFYNLSVFGKPVDATRGEVIDVAFGPNEGATRRSFLRGELRKPEMPFILMYGVHLAPIPEDAQQGEFPVVDIGKEREQAIQSLTLTEGLYPPIQLELGPMNAPLDAMRSCVADLLESQRLDPEGVLQIATGPVPTNGEEIARFIRQRYPERLLREGHGGTVAVRLTVNAQGKPTVCQIANSDRPATFDDLVCFGLLRTAEFTPAIGTDGQPRFGIYSTKVTYVANGRRR